MKRSLIIDKEYRQRMQKDNTVTESMVESYLVDHSTKVAQYISDFAKISLDYKLMKKNFSTTYSEKWAYYRFKYEYDTSATEATRLTDGDQEIADLRYEMECVEVDLKELEDYIECLKQKYWALKTWFDINKWKSGS